MRLRQLLRRLFLVSLATAWLFVLGCGSGHERPAASIGIESETPGGSGAGSTVTEPVQVLASDPSPRTAVSQRVQSPVFPEVVMKTNQGEVRIRLNAEKSPVTVDNFLANYVERGFYDQTVLHYVDQGYMIAGGGYTADLQAKATRAFIRSEADNGLKNVRGTIAMARLPEHADSATSQFYINLVDNPALDFQDHDSADKYGYCVFGEVVAGMDVIDRIGQVSVVDKDQFPKTPVQPVIIESVRRVR
jgi:cyclophilin family peptidyl-prolyl cis-trans isomerase